MSPNPQKTADLVTFTEEILNGKHHFCAVLQHLKDTGRTMTLTLSYQMKHAVNLFGGNITLIILFRI